MQELYDGLFVGNEQDCFYDNKDEWAVIHASKTPCHQRALNYRGSLPPNHPNYLTYEQGNHLYLNIIDPPQPLFKPPLFHESMRFLDHHVKEKKVLIHCNLGMSRASSIALLWLAKRTDLMSDESFRSAATDFIQIYPYYQPGRGITTYLSSNWSTFQ